MYNNGIGKDYFNAMDRDYTTASLENYGLKGSYSVGGPIGATPEEGIYGTGLNETVPEIGIDIQHIGVSANPMQDQSQAVRQRIFQGAKQVEIGFMGTGKGSQQSRTPESYGKNERINIRELAKVNEVNLTTHAAFGLGSLAGYGSQVYPSGDLQEGFNEQNRQKALHEIQKAVDFAADVSNGGAVVVHAVEHLRPLHEAGHDDKYKGKFSYYGEKEKKISPLVDPRSGRIIGADTMKDPLVEIEYEETEDGTSWKRLEGGSLNKKQFYRSMQPRIIRQDIAIEKLGGKKKKKEDYTKQEREQIELKLREKERQNPKLKEEVSQEILTRQKIAIDEIDYLIPTTRNGDVSSDGSPIPDTRKVEWEELEKEAKKYDIKPQEYWLTNHIKSNLLDAKTNKDFLVERDRDILEIYKAIKHTGENIENEQDLERIFKQIKEGQILERIASLEDEKRWKDPRNPRETEELREKLIEEKQRDYNKELINLRTGGMNREFEKYKNRLPSVMQQLASQEQSKENRLKLLEHQNIKDYTDQKVAESLAESAIYAAQRERVEKQHNPEAEKRIKKPLFIAYEPVWPEQYGGHPDEIIDTIKAARQQFVRIVTGKDKKYENHPMWKEYEGREEEAKQEAKRRLKGVWDTGHVNIWRKYMKDLDEKEFKQWYVDKAKEWMKEDIMGHVHITENLGWEDEHLPPGEGNTPIREFMDLVKEEALKEDPEERIAIITEPAHHDYKAMLGSWKLFGSSIYGADQKFKNSWLDIESAYFGRAYGSNQIYSGLHTGDADPQSWSNTPLH